MDVGALRRRRRRVRATEHDHDDHRRDRRGRRHERDDHLAHRPLRARCDPAQLRRRRGRRRDRARRGIPPAEDRAAGRRDDDGRSRRRAQAPRGATTGHPHSSCARCAGPTTSAMHFRAMPAEVLPIPSDGDRLAPATIVAALRAYGLSRIVCEGGPALATQFVEAGVVDEVCVTVSPVLEPAAASVPRAHRAVSSRPSPDCSWTMPASAICGCVCATEAALGDPRADALAPALLVVVPQLRVACDFEDLQLDEIGSRLDEVVRGVRRHEAVVVAVQDQDRMPQLRGPRDDVEAIERDGAPGAGDRRRPFRAAARRSRAR